MIAEGISHWYHRRYVTTVKQHSNGYLQIGGINYESFWLEQRFFTGFQSGYRVFRRCPNYKTLPFIHVRHVLQPGSSWLILQKGDPLIYEFYELGLPGTAGRFIIWYHDLYPGKIGNEYFMTKGHFHSILETAEIYYTLSGEGYMVMETRMEIPER